MALSEQHVGAEPSVLIELERPQDAAAVERLVAQAFGPGRFVKTAERLREGSRPIADLSFVAREAGEVVGTVRLWPVEILERVPAKWPPVRREGRAPGNETGAFSGSDEPKKALGAKVAFLGPIAVDAGRRSEGLGALLVEQACAAAEAHGWAGVLLVGDEPYFGRFGFSRAKVALPGPVNPARVLLHDLGGLRALIDAAGGAAVQKAPAA